MFVIAIDIKNIVWLAFISFCIQYFWFHINSYLVLKQHNAYVPFNLVFNNHNVTLLQ